MQVGEAEVCSAGLQASMFEVHSRAPRAHGSGSPALALAASTMVSAQLSGAWPSLRRPSIASLALRSLFTSCLRPLFSGRSSSSLATKGEGGDQG
jgi:hypothetical protein